MKNVLFILTSVALLAFCLPSKANAQAAAASRAASFLSKMMKGADSASDAAKAARAVTGKSDDVARAVKPKPQYQAPRSSSRSRASLNGLFGGGEEEKKEEQYEKRPSLFGGYDLYDKQGRFVKHVAK